MTKALDAEFIKRATMDGMPEPMLIEYRKELAVTGEHCDICYGLPKLWHYRARCFAPSTRRTTCFVVCQFCVNNFGV